jgi:sec-independent protein translocase protein TatB
MFDVGFSEILLCAIVALLVLGPEKLPGAVRTASLWIGRFRRAFNDIKSEVEREIGADDIRRQLHNEQVMKKLESGKQQLQALQNELRSIEQSARRDAAGTSADTSVTATPAPVATPDAAPDSPATGSATPGTTPGDNPSPTSHRA